MKKHNMVFSLKNFLFYLLGAILISFSVVMMIKSEVGLSSWDTLHYSLFLLTGMSVGVATIYVAMTFTAMVIIINKEIKYLGMTVPIVLVGFLINLFNDVVFIDFIPSTYIIQVLTYILGLSVLPFGGALLIISTFPAGVFDEFMLSLMRLFKSNKLVLIRVIMEISAVTLAIVLSSIAGEGFGMVNIGTLIFSLTVGIFVKTYLKLFEKIGLYTINQTD